MRPTEPPTPRCRSAPSLARGRGDAAVSEIVGAMILVAIGVAFTAVVALALMSMPPPPPTAGAVIDAHALLGAPDTVVVEHRGGRPVPLQALDLVVDLDGAPLRVNLGDRIAAGDPAWRVVDPAGVPKNASGRLEPGDQITYRSASVPGKRIAITVVDGTRGVVLFANAVRGDDVTAPTVLAARTRNATRIEVTLSEPLYNASAADFRVNGAAVHGLTLLGNGSRVELAAAPFASNATPVVRTVAAPAGTSDLAWLPLQGDVSVTSADGAPPNMTTGPRVRPAPTSASVQWTTDEPAAARVEYGPTPSLGRVAVRASLATDHAVGLNPLTPKTLYYYRVTTTDAAGNAHVTPMLTFLTLAGGSVGPTFTDPVVHLIYSSTQAKDVAARVGLAVMNPTPDPITVTLVKFTASPPLGLLPDDAFFRGILTTGPGSDPDFTCVWAGTLTNLATCAPVPPVTVPAYGVRQVVLQFQTSKAGPQAAHLILRGEAQILGILPTTIGAEMTVQHAGNNPIQTLLFALSGPGGSHRAAMPPVVAGNATEFIFRFSQVAGDPKIRTRIFLPAEWTNVSVPSQPALNQLSVTVRQPTPSSQGLIEVYATTRTPEDVDFRFRATPGGSATVLEVDVAGTKEGSNNQQFINLLWFGVQVT